MGLNWRNATIKTSGSAPAGLTATIAWNCLSSESNYDDAEVIAASGVAMLIAVDDFPRTPKSQTHTLEAPSMSVQLANEARLPLTRFRRTPFRKLGTLKRPLAQSQTMSHNQPICLFCTSFAGLASSRVWRLDLANLTFCRMQHSDSTWHTILACGCTCLFLPTWVLSSVGLHPSGGRHLKPPTSSCLSTGKRKERKTATGNATKHVHLANWSCSETLCVARKS